MDEFLKMSQYIGERILYVQGTGGNSSIKIDNKLYIKASGKKMKDMSNNRGYVCCNLNPIVAFFKDKKRFSKKHELEFIKFIENQIVRGESYGVPSMETGFHAVIPSKYVFHLHSVYINIFTCMKYGANVLKNIFYDIPFSIFDYKNPGYELAYYVSQQKSLPPVIFLKNHGVIVHGDVIAYCLELIELLHKRSESYIKQKKAYTPFIISSKNIRTNNYSFPDSAVFGNIRMNDIPDKKKKDLLEIISTQQYITQTIIRLGRVPTFLSVKEVNKLRSMKQEKRRVELMKK